MQKSSLANEDYKQLEENSLELSKVSDKLNNSEYHSQFTEAITKQAERLVEEGENLSLDEFINKKLFIINQNKGEPGKDVLVSNPKLEAESDFIVFNKYQEKQFEIFEKSNRSEEYNSSLFELLNENASTFFEKIKSFIKGLTETEKNQYDTIFESMHSASFPKFEKEHYAEIDFSLFKSRDVDFYEVAQKMDNFHYKKTFFLLYQEEAERMNLPNPENYANNKISNILEKVTALSDDEREVYKKSFDEKFPNGFKTEQEEIQIILDETQEYYEQFKENLADYLRTAQGNENEQIKRTQYMLSVLSDDPEKFDEFSERFFNDGDFKNELKEPKIAKKLNAVGTSKRFQSELVKKVIKDNNAIIEHYKGIGSIAVKSQEHLKEFRAKQFKRGHIEAQKKLQAKKAIKQSTNEISQSKLSYKRED